MQGIYQIIANKDLGKKLHSHCIYFADKDMQQILKKKIEDLLKNYSDDKFIELGYYADSTKLIEELILLRQTYESVNDKEKILLWNNTIKKYFYGLCEILERELLEAKFIKVQENVEDILKEKISKSKIFEKGDIIEISKTNNGKNIFKANYISKKFSPNHNAKFELWRDTQFIVFFNFDKGIFIWDYINVLESERRKGMGTNIVNGCEEIARELGFTRFSAEYPNKPFWTKLNYKIPDNYRIKIGKYTYTIEGYKELF